MGLYGSPQLGPYRDEPINTKTVNRKKNNSFKVCIITGTIIFLISLIFAITVQEVFMLFGLIFFIGIPVYIVILIVFAFKKQKKLPAVIFLAFCFVSLLISISIMPENIMYGNSNFVINDPEARLEFIESCSEYNYKDISRQPKEYQGKRAVFTGEVFQVVNDSLNENAVIHLLINVTNNEYFWEDTIYAVYTRTSDDEMRILEGDIIKFYGVLEGLTSYESVLGQSITIPMINIGVYELIE